MKRLILAACAAVSLTGCTKGAVVFPRPNAVAAIKLYGITDVTLLRPTFTCDAYGDIPRVSPSDGEYLQRGLFFTGKQGGKPVSGSVCYGVGRPPRILVNP